MELREEQQKSVLNYSDRSHDKFRGQAKGRRIRLDLKGGETIDGKHEMGRMEKQESIVTTYDMQVGRELA